MLSAREATKCHSALQQCPHCNKYWPTKESLDAHLRNDSKCQRAENIPFTISFVKTDYDKAPTVPDKRSTAQSSIEEINVTHHGTSKDANLYRTSTLCQKKLSSDDSADSIVLSKRLKEFRLAVKNEATRVSINVNDTLIHGVLSPIEKMVAHT